jgi:hypothetical protein
MTEDVLIAYSASSYGMSQPGHVINLLSLPVTSLYLAHRDRWLDLACRIPGVWALRLKLRFQMFKQGFILVQQDKVWRYGESHFLLPMQEMGVKPQMVVPICGLILSELREHTSSSQSLANL